MFDTILGVSCALGFSAATVAQLALVRFSYREAKEHLAPAAVCVPIFAGIAVACVCKLAGVHVPFFA